MKKTIILLISVLLYTFFLPNHVAADYSQDLDACNKILSKSTSVHEYCILNFDTTTKYNSGVFVTYSKVYPESGIARAAKFLEEEYKSTIKRWQTLNESQDLTPEVKKSGGVTEEAGPDNIKFLINKMPYMYGANVVYVYRNYLFMQQGSCVILVDGIANKRYDNTQNNPSREVSGDVEKLKKESLVYIYKVSNDLAGNCKKEIIKKETPKVRALADKPPKESDFRKVDRSNFKLVYPIGTSSANLKPATQSANLKGSVFIGKVGGEGEVVIERANGDSVSLKDDLTAHDGYTSPELRLVLSKYGTSTVRNVVPDRQIYYEEADCQIQLEQGRREQEQLQRLGSVRKASRYNFDGEINLAPIKDCSLSFEGGPMRVLIEQGQVTFKTSEDITITATKADLGIGYDTKSGTSVIEIYDGSVKVSNKSGQAKKISSVYGSEIKQIEVAKDGTMNEGIAIPQSEWEAFLASQQKEKENQANRNNLAIGATVAVLGIGGLIFFLYRTGRLIPLYKTLSQKVSGLIKKINKTGKEEEN